MFLYIIILKINWNLNLKHVNILCATKMIFAVSLKNTKNISYKINECLYFFMKLYLNRLSIDP